MPFAKEELPPIFDKIIEAMEENGGKMTTEEFREFVWRKLRLSKNDAKNIRKWLNLNGYIIINSSKEIIVSEDDIKM